jgi:predicted nuclease with TOPRIM domain
MSGPPQNPMDYRLSRIEQKIDKLSETMVALARAEEKLFTLEAEKTRMHERVDSMAHKVEKLDELVRENAITIKAITKFSG